MISLMPDLGRKTFPKRKWEDVIPLFDDLYQSHDLADKGPEEKITFLIKELGDENWTSCFHSIGIDELGNLCEMAESIDSGVELIILEKAYAQMMGWIVL